MKSDRSETGCDPARVSELFDEACELEESQRAAFLDRHCAGQPALRQAVEKLLRADLGPDPHAPWVSAAEIEARHMAAEGSLPFDSLGPYRILSRIGAGGMGAVYLAERDYDDVRRQVAIKIIPRALLDDETIRRFRQERMILARMEHPHIARMLDAGHTPDGMPYLAMEYVDGVPLDRYVAAHALPVKARMALFQSVCDAVALAHRNLIVHRDLKPHNILVTAEGVPKLLDFGIAKLLSENSDRTETAAAMMTPSYASPEQIAGGPVTTASDVYSLGVILKELMAGEKRNADLDTVIAMAMREEPERRYASVADFAEDARRAVEGYPVRARPDSLAYRARRLVSRRPWEVAVAAAMAVALAAAGVVALAQYRAAQQRFAEVRAIANSFLFEVYDAIGDQPGTTQARMLLARRAQQYLDVLARDRSSDLALRKELAASYHKLGDILGQSFVPNLGDTAAALANYQKAAEVLEGIDASGHADAALLSDWATICERQGRIASRNGELDDTVVAGRKAVSLMERAAALDPSSREMRFRLLNERLFLALAQQRAATAHNDFPSLKQAESLAAGTLEAARRLSAEDAGNDQFLNLVAKACEYLAFIESMAASGSGDPAYRDLAVSHCQEELTIIQRLYAAHPDRYRRHLSDAWADVSRAWLEAGDPRQAETAARESLRGFEEIAAGDPRNYEALRDLMLTQWHLAQALAAENRPAEAAPAFERVLSTFDRLHRQNPADTGDRTIFESRDRLAAYRLAAGHRTAAAALYRQNIEMLSGSNKPLDRITLALDYGLLGDATAPADRAQARAYYGQAAVLWETLRDSGQLPALYAGKPAELRRNSSASLAGAASVSGH